MSDKHIIANLRKNIFKDTHCLFKQGIKDEDITLEEEVERAQHYWKELEIRLEDIKDTEAQTEAQEEKNPFSSKAFNEFVRNFARHQSDFSLLGIGNNCTKEELITAYKQKCFKAHPDTGGNNKLFIELTEAKDRIMRRKFI